MFTLKHMKCITTFIAITTTMMSMNINAAASDISIDKQSAKHTSSQNSQYVSVSYLTPSLDGTELYAISGAFTGYNSLYVIDSITGETKKIIKLPDVISNPNEYGPFDMSLSPDGKMLYIVAHTEIIKIDVTNKEISAVISTGKKSSDRSLGVSGDGLKIIAADYADYGNNNETYVHIIDTQKNILSDAIPNMSATGQPSYTGFDSITVDQLTNKAYLITTNSISILDLNTKQLQHHAIQLRPKASSSPMAIDSSRGLLYFTEADKHALDILDVNSKKVIDKVIFSKLEKPKTVSLSPDGNRAYITIADTNNISVVDTKSRHIIKTLYIPGSDLKISANGKQIYTLTGSHIFGDAWSSVNIYDAETGKQIKSFPVKKM